MLRRSKWFSSRRPPVPLEHHHGESGLIVERHESAQRALVGVVVLLRLEAERQPVEFEPPERGVQRVGEVRAQLVKR